MSNEKTIDTSRKPVGVKHDSGKPMAGILSEFPLALMAIAKVGTFGAKKYARYDWINVPNAEERYYDAMWRHLLECSVTPDDPESELPHFYHFAWNVLAVLELMERSARGQRQ